MGIEPTNGEQSSQQSLFLIFIRRAIAENRTYEWRTILAIVFFLSFY
jgi:hypothetical protein